MYVQTNQPYTNRIQIVLSPFFGPFVQPGPLGDFDPRRDLEVYVDGVRQVVQTFTYDETNDRYLLFMQNAINLQGVVQIVYHTVSPPFQGRVQAEADATASTGTGSQIAWTAGTNFALGQTVVDINGNLQTVVGVIGGEETGTSGGTVPAWPTFTGGTVSDNNLIWATGVYQQTVTGFGPFDKFALNGGPTTETTIETSNLLPANESTMALLVLNATGPSIATGWVDMGATLGISSGGVQVANFPTPSVISVTETSSTRWSSIILLFAGADVPVTASITNVQVASNVLTLAVVAPDWIVGTTISFSGFPPLYFLNGQHAVVLTNSGTHITASYTHADYGPAPDSGTANYCPYLQAVEIAPGFTVAGTYSSALPNPVQAGSTIFVAAASGDNNARAVIAAVSDTHGGSYTIYNSFSPGGLPADRAGSGAAVAQHVAGGSTTVSVTLNPVNTAGGAIRVFAFELPVGSGAPFAQVPWVPGVAPSGTVTVNAPTTITPPSVVQTNTVSTASSGGVCHGSFLNPVTKNDVLAVFVYSDSTDLTVTIADNYFNAYTREIFNSDASDAIFCYSAKANSGTTFAVASAANHIGGQTTYTGTFQSFLNGNATVAGFVNPNNNGTFSIVSSTPTTLTVNNALGAAETHAATAQIPLVVEVDHGSNSRILIGLAELSSSAGVDAVANNKQFSVDTVTSGNFTTTGINELAIGFFASQTGSPGFTQNGPWTIDTANPFPAIVVSNPEPTATTDAALTTVNKVIIYESGGPAVGGVTVGGPANIRTAALTPATSNTFALLLVGTGGSTITNSVATVTNFSITSDVVTFVANNFFAAGDPILIAGLSTGTYLNNQPLTVLSSGLSGSQFEANFTHADVGSTADSGTATAQPAFTAYEGGPDLYSITQQTFPLRANLLYTEGGYGGGGAPDPSTWALALLLFKLNGSVPPTDLGGFEISGASGSGTGTFSHTTTAGNTILVVNKSNTGVLGTYSLSDTQGNAYTHFAAVGGPGFFGGRQYLDVWVAPNIVGGPNMVTWTLTSGLATNWVIEARELVVGYEFRSAAMTFYGQPVPGTGPFSQTLTISGFDFPTAVPSNATVTGLELVLHGSQTGSEFSSYLTVCPANPILASPPVFTVQLPSSAGDVTLGSPTTTFGYTLTPAFVNNPANFVFYLQAADVNGQNVSFSFDSATVRAYYYTLEDIVLGATVSGFAEIGSFSPQGDDTLFPAQATLVPSSVSSPTATALTLAWNTAAVSYVRITSGDSFDTGLIVVNGGQGTYVVPGSSPLLSTAGSVTFSMTCYNGNEVPVNVNGEASPNVMLTVYLT